MNLELSAKSYKELQKLAHQKSVIIEPTYLLPHLYLVIFKTYIHTSTLFHNLDLTNVVKNICEMYTDM